MQRVSSNATLFLKLFIPTFWTVFFGAVTVAVWLKSAELAGDSSWLLRIGMTFFYLSGLLAYGLLLLPLKRVEMDEQFVFVTNYFQNYRYPWHNVECIEESYFAGLRLVRIKLRVPGRFGQHIRFIASNKGYKQFFSQHPALAALQR